MKDTFDLRKFLTENKVTAASQQVTEIFGWSKREKEEKERREKAVAARKAKKSARDLEVARKKDSERRERIRKANQGQVISRKEMVDKRRKRMEIESEPDRLGIKKGRLEYLADTILGYENEDDAYEYIFGR